MRKWLVILLLLLPSICSAGSARRFMGVNKLTYTIATFYYTGSVQTYTIPTVAYTSPTRASAGAVLTVYGAGGGGGIDDCDATVALAGDPGSMVQSSTLTGITGTELSIYVGKGGSGVSGAGGAFSSYTNGFDGSGTGPAIGGGGGGSSAVVVGGTLKIEARGGNGGNGSDGPGGAGGGANTFTSSGTGGTGGMINICSSGYSGGNGWATIEYWK